MTIFLSKEMDNRGVRDSVSDQAIPESHNIPWSDSQSVHSHRHSNPDQANWESSRIDVNVGFLVAGGECA